MSHALLVDGAMLAGRADWTRMRSERPAIPLYADLAEDAHAVGPWLIPETSLEDFNTAEIALPARLGLSELSFDVSFEALREHLHSLRYVDTSDGQRYFLRYADMRALDALLVALDVSVRKRSLFGPLSGWRYVDRDGELKDWVKGGLEPVASRVTGSGLELKLDAKELSRLLDAMLADRLASALDELGESDLSPNADARQHAHVRAAASWLQRESIDSFAVQCAVARRSIETRSACLDRPGFAAAARQAFSRPHREYESLGESLASSAQAGST